MTDNAQQASMSRRRFGVIALGGVGAAVAGGAAVFTLTDDASPRRGDGAPIGAFGVQHDDGVYVTMTNGTEFVVEVKERGSGAVLERHEGVTAENLATIRSEYISITPTA